MTKKTTLIVGIGLLLASITGFSLYRSASSASLAKADNIVTVYRSASCSCCHAWIKHLESAGFEVKDSPTNNLSSIKTDLNIPTHARSCHTATVNGYVIEGHVPASVIKRLLKEKPKIAGIAVPGMPIGSPGMESGNQKDPYNVITFAKNGTSTIYHRENQ